MYMGILTADMRRVVEQQRLGYVATVCPDGTPNLSPKGTVAVWDDDTLIFADIRSPRTMRNLATNPAVEINVVDPIARKGYRFKGTATVVVHGEVFDRALAFFRARGTTNPIRSIVLVDVRRALPVVSPAYDLGQSEQEVRVRWQAYYQSLDRTMGPAKEE
jgi:predicted pyridoxine 5'-phosphate oxidase superfamily flavin-nucleotide-binding protein